MSKKQASKPVARMLVESSPTAKLLMLKRGRLLRVGESVTVRSIALSDKSQSWLQANVESPAANVWDMAHDLAARVKKELGQSVFIEPDTGRDSRFAKLNTPKDSKTKARKAALNALLGKKGPAKIPSQFANIAGMGGQSQKGFLGGMSSPTAGFNAPGGVDFGGMMPAIPDPLANVLPEGVMEALAMQEQASTPDDSDEELPDPRLELLSALPGWNELEPNKKRMFETEAMQMLKTIIVKKAEATEESPSVIKQLIEHDSISQSLKSYLLKAFN